MQETVSWKGHSFTLFVFVGIVVLCSIFFVLGMIVGRTQGQRAADDPVNASRTKTVAAAAENDDPVVNKRDEPIEKSAPPRESTPPEREIARPSALPANVINFQIGAVTRSDAAEKLLKEVRGRGFPAFIIAPSSGEASPLYRVQVGPYKSEA